MATRQPALKNFAAVAAPMPAAPPEMNTDLPLDIFGYLQKFIGQNFVSVLFEHSLSANLAELSRGFRIGNEKLNGFGEGLRIIWRYENPHFISPYFTK